jgi:hypothetical protein
MSLPFVVETIPQLSFRRNPEAKAGTAMPSAMLSFREQAGRL